MNTLNLTDRSWKRSSSKPTSQRGGAQVAEHNTEAGFTARTNAAEERLREVSLALAAVEARVGSLVEDFRGQIEGTLQAFQGKTSRQAKDLEKVAQLLGERWFRQFQEQGEAGMKSLRDELKKSIQTVEEGKQQLASLAEGKQAPLSKADREEFAQQLAQAIREHAQAMHEPAKVEVESIKQAVEQAIGRLEAAEQKRETGSTAQAEAMEERLRGVSSAVEALEGRVRTLVEDFQGRMEATVQASQGNGARQAEDLEKIAQDAGGRWSQQFREQAEAAMEKLREEVKNSVRVVEESKQQLASLAEAKLASLGQAAREEYSQQLAQAIRERAQVTHEPTNGEVESIKLAAEQAIAQLEAAEHKREASFLTQAEAAEERLRGVGTAVEALEGRVGTLAEDFQGRIESTLQNFQWKGARQAEDLEKIAKDVGGRWSKQFREQAEAAVEKLQEEAKNSVREVEERKQELTSLAKEKLAALNRAVREEYSQQLAQAAIAKLEVAEQKKEAGFLAQAEAAEEHLRGVYTAAEALEGRVGALVEDFQGQMESTLQALQAKGTKQAEDLGKVAQDVGGRWSQQFHEQAEAAVERVREEARNSVRVVEESKHQLASLAKTKLAVLSQVADNAAAGFEAEQKRLKNEYETSRRELEDRLESGWTTLPSLSVQRGSTRKGRGTIAQLAIVGAVCLVLMLPLLGVYLSIRTVMRLQPDPPADFIDQIASLNTKRRVPEEAVAQAYWLVAQTSLKEKYPFGSQLPAEPPNEFQVDSRYIPPHGAKAFGESRARYWEKLQRIWVQSQFWEERHEWNTQWLMHLQQIWDRLRSLKLVGRKLHFTTHPIR
jgi:hypothetical protein